MSIIVDINDFSNGSIDSSNPQDPKWDGTGVFDIIMKAANENIKIQSQTSRITGAEYAEVYLGTMQSAISEAMKFLLAKEITEKEISLKEAQIKTAYVERVIKDKEAAVLGLDNVIKLREASRSNGTYVYVPAYEEII